MVATASTEHSYWLALAFVAWNCAQRKRLRLNGNRALSRLSNYYIKHVFSVTFSLICFIIPDLVNGSNEALVSGLVPKHHVIVYSAAWPTSIWNDLDQLGGGKDLERFARRQTRSITSLGWIESSGLQLELPSRTPYHSALCFSSFVIFF